MQPTFKDFELRLLNPNFDSDLIDVLTELEKLRTLFLRGDVHPHIFIQLKTIFHMLESVGSARIEGNHTTVADYVEHHLENTPSPSENLAEIKNIERAMAYIDSSLKAGDDITEFFIRELHAIAVEGLTKEGDPSPGKYRLGSVTIGKSLHLPPEALRVPDLMQELVAFVNRQDKPKYDLMKIALAHHRFGWVHPFNNGNGRTVRLLTYALLIKYGFNVQTGGRVLNPTAVFCSDRTMYYDMLAEADKGSDEGLERWCTYVLSGMSRELKKVDNLTSKVFLNGKILIPAIQYAQNRSLISLDEAKVLMLAIDKGEFKAGDLQDLFPSYTSNQRTYQVKKLLDSGFIVPIAEGSRIYMPNFQQSYLIRGVFDALGKNGFLGGLG